MTIAVDVMLPYFGDVNQMKLAVRSVMNQTYGNWRLVVLDDGYPDSEPERWFSSISDARVTYLKNDVNLGANGNYRKAVDLLEAEWFVMMGADDVMAPTYLQTVVAAIADGVDIIQPRVDVIDEHGRAYLPVGDRVKRALSFRIPAAGLVVGGDELATSLLHGNWAYFPALAWRSETVRRVGFRRGLDVVQDLALILDIVADGGLMALRPEVAFSYRRHSRSDSSVRALDGRRFEEERRFFEGESARFAALGWTNAARAARWHVTSRLNALLMVPRAILKKGSPRTLLRHAVR